MPGKSVYLTRDHRPEDEDGYQTCSNAEEEEIDVEDQSQRAFFHLPKDSGKLREFRWEMFVGEKRVPFDTRSIHSQTPFSVRCIPHQKYIMVAQLLWLNKVVKLSLGEESLVNSRIMMTFPDSYPCGGCKLSVRCDLHQNQGFNETIFP